MREITNKRMFDLVRYMRAELHEAALITDAEYAWLSGEVGLSKPVPEGGSQSRERLKDYDELRAALMEAVRLGDGLASRLKGSTVVITEMWETLQNALGLLGVTPDTAQAYPQLYEKLAHLRTTIRGEMAKPPCRPCHVG